MATFYSDVMTGLNANPVQLPSSAQQHGELYIAQCKVDLATNNIDHTDPDSVVELFKLPKGARVVGGRLITNVSFGSAVVGVGTVADPAKYLAEQTYTVINVPLDFGVAADLYEPLAAEETVVLNVETADMPNSAGNFFIVQMWYTVA